MWKFCENLLYCNTICNFYFVKFLAWWTRIPFTPPFTFIYLFFTSLFFFPQPLVSSTLTLIFFHLYLLPSTFLLLLSHLLKFLCSPIWNSWLNFFVFYFFSQLYFLTQFVSLISPSSTQFVFLSFGIKNLDLKPLPSMWHCH